MPHVNPIVRGKKVCRKGHRYDLTALFCPECRYVLVRKYDRRRYQRSKKIVDSLKEGKVCKRCGFDDPRALVWHHRDPFKKSFSISQWLGYNKSPSSENVKRLKAEIKKCDLICANCHWIEHAA
jgi:hypothetical protein